MNPRPKAAGKGRTRRPETVLRYARESVNSAHRWNNEPDRDAHWLELNQALLRTLTLLAELRRSLWEEK